MSRSKTWVLLTALCALLLVFTVAACGDDDEGDSGSAGGGQTAESGGEEPKEKLKIGAALIGPKNDKSFNEAAYNGIQQALKENPDAFELTALLENRENDQARTDAIETLAPINDIIVGVSASFGPVYDIEAPKFPDTKFVQVGGLPSKYHENVYAFANDWGAPAFVAGAIAATMTKSKVIGYVGGAEIPPTVHGQNGFVAGAKHVDPSVKVLTNVIGSFDDVAKAKAATTAMIDDNADVIFPFLDSGAAGSFAAGTESGKNPAMFKLTIPECDAYPNMIGTEVVNNTQAAATMLGALADGSAKPGAIMITLQDPKIQTLELCPEYAEQEEIANITKETIDKINSGEIKLPANALNPRPNYPYREGMDGEIQNADQTG